MEKAGKESLIPKVTQYWLSRPDGVGKEKDSGQKANKKRVGRGRPRKSSKQQEPAPPDQQSNSCKPGIGLKENHLSHLTSDTKVDSHVSYPSYYHSSNAQSQRDMDYTSSTSPQSPHPTLVHPGQHYPPYVERGVYYYPHAQTPDKNTTFNSINFQNNQVDSNHQNLYNNGYQNQYIQSQPGLNPSHSMLSELFDGDSAYSLNPYVQTTYQNPGHFSTQTDSNSTQQWNHTQNMGFSNTDQEPNIYNQNWTTGNPGYHWHRNFPSREWIPEQQNFNQDFYQKLDISHNAQAVSDHQGYAAYSNTMWSSDGSPQLDGQLLEDRKPPAPLYVQTSAPLSVQTPAPHSVLTPAPHSVQTPAPHSVLTPAPHSVQTPAPHSVLTPAPHSLQTPTPLSVQTPDPSIQTSSLQGVGSGEMSELCTDQTVQGGLSCMLTAATATLYSQLSPPPLESTLEESRATPQPTTPPPEACSGGSQTPGSSRSTYVTPGENLESFTEGL